MWFFSKYCIIKTIVTNVALVGGYAIYLEWFKKASCRVIFVQANGLFPLDKLEYKA